MRLLYPILIATLLMRRMLFLDFCFPHEKHVVALRSLDNTILRGVGWTEIKANYI